MTVPNIKPHDARSLDSNLTRGSVSRHLVRLTVPMVGGILAAILFNLVDTYFVAQLGTRELAAISFTFPVVMLMINLGVGLGAGASSAIALAVGQHDHHRVQRLTTDALLLAALLVGTLSAVGLLTIEPLFRLLGATDGTLPAVHAYMSVFYWGAVFVVVPMVGMAAIRARGDARVPGLVMVAAAVINALLDPLLIFGLLGLPRLGIRGAAIASVIARAFSLLATLHVLHRRWQMLSWRRPPLGEMLASWRSMLHVGLPAAGTNMIIPVCAGAVTALVATHGEAAVAAFGAASRIEAVALVVFFALSSIIGPFAGQNLGAGQHERLEQAMRVSFRLCIVMGAAAALVLAIFATPLASLFDSTAQVVQIAVLYLHVVPLSYGLAGVVMVVNATLNGLGRPGPAVMISATRMVLVYLPAAYLGSRLFGVGGIFGAATLANLVVGLGAYVYVRRMCTRLR